MAAFAFGLITLVFVYTTAVNVIERPDGVKIASFFIGAISVTSEIPRRWPMRSCGRTNPTRSDGPQFMLEVKGRRTNGSQSGCGEATLLQMPWLAMVALPIITATKTRT